MTSQKEHAMSFGLTIKEEAAVRKFLFLRITFTADRKVMLTGSDKLILFSRPTEALSTLLATVVVVVEQS